MSLVTGHRYLFKLVDGDIEAVYSAIVRPARNGKQVYEVIEHGVVRHLDLPRVLYWRDLDGDEVIAYRLALWRRPAIAWGFTVTSTIVAVTEAVLLWL